MNIKKILIVTIIFFANTCFAQSAKDATRSLQKLQAKVEASVDYKDYTVALGDAIFEIKLFLSSPDAKNKQEFAISLNNTLEHYQKAAEIWSRSIQGSCQPTCEEEEKNIAVLFPELADQIRSRRVSVQTLRKQAMLISFKKAEKELEITVLLFSQK